MEGFHYVDIFASKGLEYMLVISFLAAFAIVWWLLTRPGRAKRRTTPAENRLAPSVERFVVKDDVHYHPGHTWARTHGDRTMRVGIDDFAQRLLGRVESVQLPSVGTKLTEGCGGCEVSVHATPVELLSPVSGQIVAINPKVVGNPGLINDDPYGDGWLFEVRVPELRTVGRNLLSGRFAKAWMAETVDAIRDQMMSPAGPVLQDGGTPVTGIAAAISPDRWHDVVSYFLRTD